MVHHRPMIIMIMMMMHSWWLAVLPAWLAGASWLKASHDS
jgi:hypothetical protein